MRSGLIQILVLTASINFVLLITTNYLLSPPADVLFAQSKILLPLHVPFHSPIYLCLCVGKINTLIKQGKTNQYRVKGLNLFEMRKTCV
jgi:hypothetical protein